MEEWLHLVTQHAVVVAEPLGTGHTGTDLR